MLQLLNFVITALIDFVVGIIEELLKYLLLPPFPLG